MTQLGPHLYEGLHFHVACGLGGGARGWNRAVARLRELALRWRCVGGVDVDPAGLADFARLAGVAGTLLDLFTREQYRAWHGREPPEGWREAVPEDFRRAAGGERPNLVFTSCPCKGNSGLLAETVAATAKYQALNELALRAMWLGLEAWADDPVEFYLFENVPRISSRSRPLLDQINSLFAHFGYAFAETRHDCGRLGGLAQTRKRHLSVFRHRAKVPPFLYEPPQRPLRGVGEVLERLPLPGDIEAAGPMHRVPTLQWKTWVRLALVEAGSDWRSLNRLAVEDGVLRDYGIAAERPLRNRALGVMGWGDSSGAVIGESFPSNGRFAVADPTPFSSREGSGFLGVRGWEDHAFLVTGNGRPGSGPHSVADPRVDGHAKSVQLGVRSWDKPAGVVTGQMFAGGGPNSIADPRVTSGARFNNVYRVVRFDEAAPAVTGGGGNSAATVADPRYPWGAGAHQSKMRVVAYDAPAGCVTGSDRVGSGAQSVADPRVNLGSGAHRYHATQAHYGVLPWAESAGAVTGHGKHDNGRWTVADPRGEQIAEDANCSGLPDPAERLVCVIRALDGTWHRPFTTLDLAALQSLFDPEDAQAHPFVLDGKSDSAWRERIGNAVPSDAAEAMAVVFGRTLLAAWTGQSIPLGAEPVWVRPLAIAAAVDVAEGVAW
jgi:site-specific DNA-cytosine methylase